LADAYPPRAGRGGGGGHSSQLRRPPPSASFPRTPAGGSNDAFWGGGWPAAPTVESSAHTGVASAQLLRTLLQQFEAEAVAAVLSSRSAARSARGLLSDQQCCNAGRGRANAAADAELRNASRCVLWHCSAYNICHTQLARLVQPAHRPQDTIITASILAAPRRMVSSGQ